MTNCGFEQSSESNNFLHLLHQILLEDECIKSTYLCDLFWPYYLNSEYRFFLHFYFYLFHETEKMWLKHFKNVSCTSYKKLFLTRLNNWYFLKTFSGIKVLAKQNCYSFQNNKRKITPIFNSSCKKILRRTLRYNVWHVSTDNFCTVIYHFLWGTYNFFYSGKIMYKFCATFWENFDRKKVNRWNGSLTINFLNQICKLNQKICYQNVWKNLQRLQ